MLHYFISVVKWVGGKQWMSLEWQQEWTSVLVPPKMDKYVQIFNIHWAQPPGPLGLKVNIFLPMIHFLEHILVHMWVGNQKNLCAWSVTCYLKHSETPVGIRLLCTFLKTSHEQRPILFSIIMKFSRDPPC